jgi:hypothetical protein
LPPNNAMKWVKVLNSIYLRVSHAANMGFLNVMSLMDCLERKPVLTIMEGVADVAD